MRLVFQVSDLAHGPIVKSYLNDLYMHHIMNLTFHKIIIFLDSVI